MVTPVTLEMSQGQPYIYMDPRVKQVDNFNIDM